MKHFGLIGFPLEHSFSKSYYDRKFKEENWDADYQVFPISSEELLRAFVRENSLDGYNVTLPYKEKIIPLLDDVSEEAKAIGAVNCVMVTAGKSMGYNTDVYGIEASLQKLVDLKPVPSLVFGTGGASKAVQYVLKKYGFPYQVVGRTKMNAHLTYQELTKKHFDDYSLLIQCTPVGMWPQTDECIPIPYEFICPHHYCFDLIYNPEETRFLQNAKEKGATVLGGMLMLITQAQRNFVF